MACSYVLLHHVMGELDGKKNAWGYAEGGMGGVSQSIARAAKSYGATLHTDCVRIPHNSPSHHSMHYNYLCV